MHRSDKNIQSNDRLGISYLLLQRIAVFLLLSAYILYIAQPNEQNILKNIFDS